MDAKIAQLQEIINKTKRLAFFGGAGVSVPSGIPDFRSSNGIYSEKFGQIQPEVILSRDFLFLQPEIFFDFYRSRMLYPDAKPNACHLKLLEMEKKNLLRGLVTQNVDGLHRKCGNIRLYELHGSVWENSCIECGEHYPLSFILESKGIPRCSCGGLVRPEITLYGEALNKYVMMGACREISRSDTLIVAGTSLAVEPAASCLEYFHGKELVVINQTETPADSQATLVIHGDVAEVMEQLTVPEPKPDWLTNLNLYD